MSFRNLSAQDISILIGHAWFFAGGALVTLLISIFDVARRSALKLTAGCVLGGLGALLAGSLMEGSKWQLVAAGIAAVMTENIVMGLIKASKEFRENPLDVLIKIATSIIPGLSSLRRP